MAKSAVALSPDDRGFLFGDGIYEVIRSYGGSLFHLDAHLDRLARNLREIRIDPAAAGIEEESIHDTFGEIARELVLRNRLETGDSLVYIQVTRGPAPRSHAFPEAGVPTVYACATPFDPPAARMECGARVILVPEARWGRCDIKSVALLASVLAGQEAVERGADEAVFVRDGVITEGTRSSFCAFFDGRLVTHPVNNRILAGVTRGVVLDLCGELGVTVREEPIRESALPRADEMSICGTTSEVTPVVCVDGRDVGDGKPGPVTRKLQRAFRASLTLFFAALLW